MFTVTKRVAVDAVGLAIPLDDIHDGEGKPVKGLPLRKRGSSVWSIVIDLATGQIKGWPAGKPRRVCAKVVDAGTYFLLSGGREVARLEGYVPQPIPGMGDKYIDLDVDATGRVTNWDDPADVDLSAFDDSEEG